MRSMPYFLLYRVLFGLPSWQSVIEHDGVVVAAQDDHLAVGAEVEAVDLVKSFHGTPWQCGSSAALCWSASGRRLPTMTRS